MKYDEMKRHRPDIIVVGEGKALAYMPEDPMGVWCHIQDVNDLIAKKDEEIESLKASHYAEMVDAGMRERRLRRELWLARAERAKEKQQLFYFSLSYDKLCIDGFFNPSSGRRELSPKKWIKVFNKVEQKCRAKAEEYK